MRIGELAAMVGISTRAVRHYHRLGVLPEPERRANGYRDYRLRDAVELARIRRLAELGMALEDVRQVLAADRRRDLRQVLSELDADLARQQQEIATRRERLAALLAEADLHPDSTVSPEMAAVLTELPAGDSALARLDREMLALVDTVAKPGERARMAELIRPFTEPEALARARDLYARLDELAEAEPDDPRVAALAGELADQIPDEMAELMAAGRADAPGGAGTGDPEAGGRDAGGREAGGPDGSDPEAGGPGGSGPDELWLELLHAEMAPAQAEVFRLLVRRLGEPR